MSDKTNRRIPRVSHRPTPPRGSAIVCALQRSRVFVIVATLIFAGLPGGRVQAAAGDLDTTFGELGVARTAFYGTDLAQDVKVRPDGRIVVAGFTHSPNSTPDLLTADIALAQYNSDGSPDASFGDGGKVTTDFFGAADEVVELALQPDGKIVVAGITFRLDGGADFALARYNTDGTLDLSFGEGGRWPRISSEGVMRRLA
jgi:uncharacterized delta-60 repeat protein